MVPRLPLLDAGQGPLLVQGEQRLRDQVAGQGHATAQIVPPAPADLIALIHAGGGYMFF